ncbi:MCE family protein [Mycobacterium sp.]|uniref:MCE family protein n=1 Tax=Mycobacterium sp. TaxID=1785 RepID=UPI003BAC312F
MATRALTALGLAATAVIAAGCSTSGLADLPLPAPGVGSGGYKLTAVFSNALNLPADAKVKLAGADVGQVDSMSARNYTAVTTLRIKDGVRLPVGTTAELRSATPLGDVFVAVKPPNLQNPGAPLLKDGDTIGLDSTAAAATVESVLSSAAILINGGAVRNLTNIINGFGKATGNQGKAFGDLVHESNRLLGTLNARSDQIQSALSEMSRLADQLDAKNQTISEVMAAAAPATDTLAAQTSQIADLVGQVGDTTRQLARFPSVAGTDTSGRSIIMDANTIARSFNDVATNPDTNLAALNRLLPPVIKATPSSSISVRVSVDKLVLGSIPDIGFKGDPGLHGPKRYDWHKLVGSLKYTLWRLQERVVGRGPGR